MEKFILGLAIGMAGGALVVANNCKLLNLIKKNQEDIMKKAEQYIDSKLEALQQKVEEAGDMLSENMNEGSSQSE